MAADFNGGSIELEYSAFTEDSDVNRTTLRGQAELGFTRNFATQLDGGFYDYGYSGDGTNVVLHGIYHGSESASFGAYVGRDELEGLDGTLYGVEGGLVLTNTIIAEAYAGGMNSDGENVLMLGVDLANSFGNGFSARAGFDYASSEFVDVTKLDIGVNYSIANQTNFYAELGSVSASGFGLSDNQTYVGAGIKIDFGARPGATFGYRSLFDILPGG
ncbi:MAG: hypothetical protein CML68_11965 [Rhodobacteraceae bacterium]|nr:hypothetical protein [Paracoccaceae bacterium]